MDAYAEEIWKERLSNLIDTSKIKDKKSFIAEINKLDNTKSRSQGNPKAKQQLLKHIESFFGVKDVEKKIVTNIYNTTNLRELKKLSRQRPRKPRKAAIRRINQII